LRLAAKIGSQLFPAKQLGFVKVRADYNLVKQVLFMS